MLLWSSPQPDINNNNNIGLLFFGDTRIYCTRYDNIALAFDSCNIVIVRALYSCIPIKAIQYYIIIFQYALIHQSDARTTRGYKHILCYFLCFYYTVRIVKCHFVTLRIRTVQKLHSKLYARELTLWSLKFCTLQVRLEDKFIITRALLHPISNLAGTQKRYIFPYSTRACVITYIGSVILWSLLAISYQSMS